VIDAFGIRTPGRYIVCSTAAATSLPISGSQDRQGSRARSGQTGNVSVRQWSVTRLPPCALGARRRGRGAS